MKYVHLVNLKDMIIYQINEEIKTKRDNKIDEIYKILKPHDMLDNEDLNRVLKNKHIPKIEVFYDLNINNFAPLKKEGLLLLHLHEDASLENLFELVQKLGKNNFGLLSAVTIPTDIKEHLIIIS